ncbi:MAG: PulJ/GspJ family protein [Fimbriimonadales bacterium]
MKRQRGSLMMEMLIGSVIAILIGTVVFRAFLTSASSRENVIGQNKAAAAARAPIDALADHLRNSQLFATLLSPNGSVLAAGTRSDITYHATTAGEQVRYFLRGSQLIRVVDGTETVALRDVSTLSFTYYRAPKYNWPDSIATTNPHAPTFAEMPFLTAIHIKASVTIDGYKSYYSSVVRLRNSPRKRFS